eukprot:Colp12_sorted_trinity150504_noHs@28247
MGALSFFKVSFIWRSLKPVDYLLLGYLLITFPLLFIAPSVEKVALGIVGAGIGVWVTAHVRYIPPISDWQYSKRPGMLPLSNVEAAPLLSPIADSQKTQGPYYVINSP